MFISVKQIVTIIIFCLSITLVNGQSNRALLVAIDKYPTNSGWNEIHATNDVAIVLPMLERQGFRRQNIICLLGEKATKAVIVQALERLRRSSQQGDCIYIHFSCHGQQMADDNGDEPDGYDEAIVPYDAPRRYESGVYEGKNHLRDDEFGRLTDNIRAKIGHAGRMTVVIDACHSGTANRDTDDDTYVRGTTYIFAPETYIPRKGLDKNEINRDVAYAPLTVLSACEPDQINYEYRNPSDNKYYGTLSFALSKALQNNKNVSREQLIKLMETMAPNSKKKQIPYIETSHETESFKIGR